MGGYEPEGLPLNSLFGISFVVTGVLSQSGDDAGDVKFVLSIPFLGFLLL